MQRLLQAVAASDGVLTLRDISRRRGWKHSDVRQITDPTQQRVILRFSGERLERLRTREVEK